MIRVSLRQAHTNEVLDWFAAEDEDDAAAVLAAEGNDGDRRDLVVLDRVPVALLDELDGGFGDLDPRLDLVVVRSVGLGLAGVGDRLRAQAQDHVAVFKTRIRHVQRQLTTGLAAVEPLPVQRGSEGGLDLGPPRRS